MGDMVTTTPAGIVGKTRSCGYAGLSDLTRRLKEHPTVGRPYRAVSPSKDKEAVSMADRRAGPRQGPYVPSPGGGKEPRSRNQDGTWRAKHSDAGKPRSSRGGTGKKGK